MENLQASEVLRGMTTEDWIYVLGTVAIVAIGLWLVRTLLRVGKLLLSLVAIAAVLSFSGLSYVNAAVVTEKAINEIAPVSVSEKEISFKDLKTELVHRFTDSQQSEWEKFKNTRLALLLADVIERVCSEVDGDAIIEFKNFDVEVYSGTVKIVSKNKQ